MPGARWSRRTFSPGRKFPDTGVLSDYDFGAGDPAGAIVGLMDGGAWGGAFYLGNVTNQWRPPVRVEYIPGGGGRAITVATRTDQDQASNAATYHRFGGTAMMIERDFQPVSTDASILEFSTTIAYTSIFGDTGWRAIDFGLDTADLAGNRAFFKVRKNNWSGAAAKTNWSVQTDSTTFVDIPNPVVDGRTINMDLLFPGLNEDKADKILVAFRINVRTGQYLSMQIGTIIIDLTGLNLFMNITALATFILGCNPNISARNRIDNTVGMWKDYTTDANAAAFALNSYYTSQLKVYATTWRLEIVG